ncbi:AAEL001902-PA [Aedes aegypti]|uniref:AAEL001902-PA n=1 Tax=Aedes aegypti TaxID=7159 RepID=Q17JW3_AEDAE|nr:AAEL001902-PA [Aedes aegypti]
MLPISQHEPRTIKNYHVLLRPRYIFWRDKMSNLPTDFEPLYFVLCDCPPRFDFNMQELELLAKVFQILKSENVFDSSSKDKIFPFEHPEDLKTILNLELRNDLPQLDSANQEDILRKIIRYSIKTAHPNYHHEMYAGPDWLGLAASWTTDALNACQFTYEAAPVFSLVESFTLKYFLKLCGFEAGEGVFTPGGSMANMYAPAMARHRLFPENKKHGMYSCQKLKMFTSEDSHYSVTKSANWLGLGEENVLRVRTDATSRIDTTELEVAIVRSIAEGDKPLIVSVTAGTTVFGAFDDLNRVADICQQHQIWLHVDAAWGCAALFSERHRPLLAGLERADSVSLCPQKMLGAPLQCAMFLMKHTGLLAGCNAACAEYLFQIDKYYDTAYDTGDMSVQCSRKIDAFKLWFMLKARGSAWFRSYVDNAMNCATYFHAAIIQNDHFKPVRSEYQFTNICFWFIPKRLQLSSPDEETEEWWSEVYKVTLALKEKMVKKGTLMVSYSSYPQKKLGYFFRLVVKCVPEPTIDRMDFIIKEMIALGSDM